MLRNYSRYSIALSRNLYSIDWEGTMIAGAG